jgi:hypothetical protein
VTTLLVVEHLAWRKPWHGSVEQALADVAHEVVRMAGVPQLDDGSVRELRDPYRVPIIERRTAL